MVRSVLRGTVNPLTDRSRGRSGKSAAGSAFMVCDARPQVMETQFRSSTDSVISPSSMARTV